LFVCSFIDEKFKKKQRTKQKRKETDEDAYDMTEQIKIMQMINR